MDIQLKRGLLDVCVLAAIKNEDSYGYKIIKDLKPYVELSESTLYTILKRLESAQLLTVRTAEHGAPGQTHATPQTKNAKSDFLHVTYPLSFVFPSGDDTIIQAAGHV